MAEVRFAYILRWTDQATSETKVVRVYLDGDRARTDYNLAQQSNGTRVFDLLVMSITGD